MTRRQYAGGAARTTITGSIGSSGGGSVIIADVTGWPDGAVGPFHVIVDAGSSAEEKILVTSRIGTTLTFSVGGRGADGTVATSHAAGGTIWHVMTAVDLDEANAHINAVGASHTAAQITFAPTGGIGASTVQAAIVELDSELDTRIDAVEAVDWVTQTRMASASVGTAEIIDANVTLAKLATDSVDASKILAGVVGTSELGAAVTTWTPQVDQGASTNIAKTINEAKRVRIGDIVWFWLDLSMTGAGTAGSAVTVTLPLAAVGHASLVNIGNALYFDASQGATLQRFSGSWELATTTQVVIQGTDPQAAGYWGPAGNTAVASGDRISGSGFYRVA